MAIQVNSEHWLVIFILDDKVVSTLMDSDGFIDLFRNEAESRRSDLVN